MLLSRHLLVAKLYSLRWGRIKLEDLLGSWFAPREPLRELKTSNQRPLG